MKSASQIILILSICLTACFVSVKAATASGSSKDCGYYLSTEKHEVVDDIQSLLFLISEDSIDRKVFERRLTSLVLELDASQSDQRKYKYYTKEAEGLLEELRHYLTLRRIPQLPVQRLSADAEGLLTITLPPGRDLILSREALIWISTRRPELSERLILALRPLANRLINLRSEKPVLISWDLREKIDRWTVRVQKVAGSLQFVTKISGKQMLRPEELRAVSAIEFASFPHPRGNAEKIIIENLEEIPFSDRQALIKILLEVAMSPTGPKKVLTSTKGMLFKQIEHAAHEHRIKAAAQKEKDSPEDPPLFN